MRSISITHAVRLAAFPFGLGVAVVFVSSTLNRVMIVELELPAALVGAFFAIPFLIAPARAWLGYVSDGYPIWGKRREPYIVIGALVAGSGIVGATLIALNSEAAGVVMAGGMALMFLAYALGHTLASNTFEALLADKFEGDQRPRAVTLFKVAMFVGILGGAIGLGRLLDPYDAARFRLAALIVMAVYGGFAIVAVTRQEPRVTNLDVAAREAKETAFRDVIREVWRDPAARRFFVLVVLSVLGTLAQDVLLEPYGALVLGLSVAQTTRLTAIWGTGTILAMVIAGVWMIKRTGYMRVLRVGLVINVAVFVGIVIAGAMGSATLFRGLVFALGIGTGLAMAGLLTAVIEFTTFTRAGLLMGVWGMAAEFGQAGGGMIGGVVVDVVLRLTADSHLVAYGTVFLLEGPLLVVALALTYSVKVDESAAQTEAEFDPQAGLTLAGL